MKQKQLIELEDQPLEELIRFKISYLQILDEEGVLKHAIPPFLGTQELLSLYYRMQLMRAFDQKAINLQRTGKIGTYPPSLGQEAISAAIAQTMAKEDIFFPSYRDQGVLFQRGLSIKNAFAWWSGDERGNLIEEGYPDYPPCIPIATQCLHAAGAAFAIKFRKEKRAVLAILGDGATSKGDFYEAVNLAGVWDLPVVFVINNNQWAISVPLHKQTKCQYLSQKAIAGGVEALTVDGNDVMALTSAISQALDQAKNASQPTVIEALTYRLSDHTTADDSKRYRNPLEVEKAWKKDPISRFENFLKTSDILGDEKKEQILSQIDEEITQGMQEFFQLSPQKGTAMLDNLYETWPDALIDQREEIKREGSWKSH